MQLVLFGHPNEKQKQFFLSKARHTAYGGARGGGKSWAMRRKFVLLAMRYRNLSLLLLRRTLTELRENHTIHLQKELRKVAKYVERERAFLFPNGSRLKLGYCDSESDIFQYQGQEYDVIGMEEATHFTSQQRDFLTTCNRNVRPDFAPRMYYTANPGGPGHSWFKRIFIDRQLRDGEDEKDYLFIPATVHDNPVLMKNSPEYVRVLEGLPEALKRAHLYGDWDVFAGQFFPEFSRQKHVVAAFEIPKEWEKFRSLDYGMDMTACYWWAIDPQTSRHYIYRELYEPYLTLSQAARRIMGFTPSGEEIKYTVGSPDLWNKRQESGISGAQIMSHEGLSGLIKANDNRIAGWRVVREYLAGDRPKLAIFPVCTNLIRTMPQLQYDKVRVEDAANSPHEVTHASESVRYGVMSRPIIAKLAEREGFFTPSEREDLKQEEYKIRKI